MGDLSLIPGLGRSPGEGNGYPLQYSGLENSMDCIVPGVTKSRSQSEETFTSFTLRLVGLQRMSQHMPNGTLQEREREREREREEIYE